MNCLRYRFSSHLCKQTLVLVHYVIPIVNLLDARLSAVAVGVNQRAVAQDALQFLGQIVFVGVSDTGVANGFYVLWRGEREHAITEAHCFQEGGMRATYFGGVNVAVGVLL